MKGILGEREGVACLGYVVYILDAMLLIDGFGFMLMIVAGYCIILSMHVCVYSICRENLYRELVPREGGA